MGHARGERTITLQQVSARVIAMEAGVNPDAGSIAIPEKGDAGVAPSGGAAREPT